MFRFSRGNVISRPKYKCSQQDVLVSDRNCGEHDLVEKLYVEQNGKTCFKGMYWSFISRFEINFPISHQIENLTFH